jgi:hypothetical protein
MVKYGGADARLRMVGNWHLEAMNSSFNTLRQRGWRDWLGALALLGLVMRALVPAGFMPAPVHGEVRLVLCSVPSAGAARTDQLPRSGSDNAACPFAASGTAMAPQPRNGACAPILLSLVRLDPLYRAPPDAAPLRHAAARGPPNKV